MPGYGRDPHGEGGFVGVLDGVGDAEFRTSFAEAIAVLGCGVYGDIEDGGGFDHFLGGEDAVDVEVSGTGNGDWVRE